MMAPEDFGVDASGLSEETKLVLEQAMKALTFKNDKEASAGGAPRSARLSSLGKLSDYEAQSNQSSQHSPSESKSSLSPAILPKAAQVQQVAPTRATPSSQESNGNAVLPAGAESTAIPWKQYPVYRKVEDLSSDVDVSVSQLASQGMVPGYRSSGQIISVPRQAQPHTAARPQQRVSSELATHLREAVDKDIAALVDQIKTRSHAAAVSRGAPNLADPSLTDEDKKLLYQEIYGYGSYPPSSVHSSRSASPSSRHRHDWHSDFYVNRQELLGADSVSGSEAGSLRGSADIPLTRITNTLATEPRSNPLLNFPSEVPAAAAQPYRVAVPSIAAQMSRTAAPPPAVAPEAEKLEAEALTKSHEEASLQSRPLDPAETTVKLKYLDPVEVAVDKGKAEPWVVDIPEDVRTQRSVVDIPPSATALLSAKRPEPPFNFTSASSVPYGSAPMHLQQAEPPLNFGGVGPASTPALLASQRSEPPYSFASQQLLASHRSGAELGSHTAALLSSQRAVAAEPPFSVASEPPFNFASTAPIQVVSPAARPGSLTGTSPVRGGLPRFSSTDMGPVSLRGFPMASSIQLGNGLSSSQLGSGLSLHASAPALNTVLNQSFGSDLGSFSFSDVYQSSDLSRGLRSSVSFAATPPLRAALPPQAIAPPQPAPQAPWRDEAAPPSEISATCTMGQSGAVARVQWSAGPWKEAVFELQILLLSLKDEWRTAYVGGDTVCTIPSLRPASTFAVRVRASDAQSSSNFSAVVHFSTPESAPAPAPEPAPAAAPAESAAAALVSVTPTKAPEPQPAPEPEKTPPPASAPAPAPAEAEKPAKPEAVSKKKAKKASAAAQKAAPPPPAQAAAPPAPTPPVAVEKAAAAPTEQRVSTPSPRVLRVVEAQPAAEPTATPPPAAQPAPSPAVRESAQESSDVGNYVSFSEGFLATPVLSSAGASYPGHWSERAGLSSSLRSQGVPLTSSRTLTSGPYLGTAYGTSVGGHPLITPIPGSVRYNTGTDIRYTSGDLGGMRSPPPVTFAHAGPVIYAGGPTVTTSPVRTQTITYNSFA